jgi:hypothetical protein
MCDCRFKSNSIAIHNYLATSCSIDDVGRFLSLIRFEYWDKIEELGLEF